MCIRRGDELGVGKPQSSLTGLRENLATTASFAPSFCATTWAVATQVRAFEKHRRASHGMKVTEEAAFPKHLT